MEHDEKMYAMTVFEEVKNVAENEAKRKGYINFFNDLFSDKFKKIKIKPCKERGLEGLALTVDCIFYHLPDEYTSLLTFSDNDYFDYDGNNLYHLIFAKKGYRDFGITFATRKTYSSIDEKYWYKIAYTEFLNFILNWNLEITIEYDETNGEQEVHYTYKPQVYYKYKELNRYVHFTTDMKTMIRDDPKAFIAWMILDPLESLLHDYLKNSFGIFEKEK